MPYYLLEDNIVVPVVPISPVVVVEVRGGIVALDDPVPWTSP